MTDLDAKRWPTSTISATTSDAVIEPRPEITSDSAAATLGPHLAGRAQRLSVARRRGALLDALAPAALLLIVAMSLVLVVMTAAHPTFMTPTTNARYFPSWMAGPMGALWPGRALGEKSAHVFVTVLMVLMYLAYVTALLFSGRLRARWVLAAILALHLLFLLAPPLQYTDVFNYLNYARMGVVHHLNPYTTVPLLEPQNDPAFLLSNWHWLVSPYGPVFTLGTYLLVPLGVTGGFWALKLILCISSLATLLLVWRAAGLLGRDQVRAIVLVGLNPIVLVWGLGADHNDTLMVLPLTLGVYLMIRARAGAGREGVSKGAERVPSEALAAVAFVLAAGVKASAAVVIPIAFLTAPHRRAFAAGLACALVVLGAASLLAFGAHLPGLGPQTRLVTGVGPANLLGWILGQGGETDLLRGLLNVLAGAFVLGAALLALRPGRDWIALAGASLFVVWVSTSWFSPWYIAWILPFAALAETRRLTVAVLAIGVYILLVFGPEVTPMLHALHFDPFGSPLGREHARLTSHLVQ